MNLDKISVSNHKQSSIDPALNSAGRRGMIKRFSVNENAEMDSKLQRGMSSIMKQDSSPHT